MDAVDLDVVGIAHDLYALTARVERQPQADDVSRRDWRAVELAIRDLHAATLEKLRSTP